MSEALEKWDIPLVQSLLPRIYQIVIEIDRRFCEELQALHYDQYDIDRMRVLYDHEVRMANLAVIGSHSVNGVSKLHSQIIKDSVFNDYYVRTPEKFKNVTNGIASRRWLYQSNPGLTNLLKETIGEDWLRDMSQLSRFKKYEDDKTVLDRLAAIKRENKERLAKFVFETDGVKLNVDSVFDTQVKRLHEYKRQQLNALYVIHKYLEIKRGKKPETPITVIFGAKAAPAYITAQDIIHLILCLQEVINNDSDVSPYLKVVMVENYNVTAAEQLIPACDISEQISLASKEASGTGNMKFMLNGAVTLGTEDGANVEIHELVGDQNIYIFGDTSDTVVKRYKDKSYRAQEYYKKDKDIKEAVDFINGKELLSVGNKERLERLKAELINKDWFMTFPDFQDYISKREKAYSDYKNRKSWAKKMLINISKAGYFSSDRTIAEYNEDIWHT